MTNFIAASCTSLHEVHFLNDRIPREFPIIQRINNLFLPVGYPAGSFYANMSIYNMDLFERKEKLYE